MQGILQDLRFALRTIRRGPLFATIAILSLTLGIGANTAIFTLMDQLMLRMLPVKDPEQLVMLFQKGAHNGSNMGQRMHSYAIYRDFQQKAEPFSEVLCRRQMAAAVSFDGTTERIDSEMVSGNFFSMLGVKPAAGRIFSSQEDDRIYRGHPVAVLSYNYWVNRFAQDPKVIGKKILVNDYPMTVVGVAAAGFTGIDPAVAPQLWTPILMLPVMAPEWPWLKIDDRRTRWVQVFGRLKPGYTVETAQAPMSVLFHQIRQEEMTRAEAAKWSKYQREQFMKGSIHIEQAATGYSQLRNSFSKALIVLMCMVGLVLLIACANVANLMIARAFARQKEIAVRLSIGASRGQLVRQLMVESMLLSLFGGIGGVALAVLLTKALLKLVPTGENALLIRAVPDVRILAFAMGLTFLTCLIFGLVPALRASRPDLMPTLKDAMGSIAGSGGSLLLRKTLVATQVALSFLLLFGAGLFVRSLENLIKAPTGFEELDNLVTFRLAPALSGYSPVRMNQFYSDLLDNLRATPGIKSAGIASVSLLSGDEWDSSTSVEGHKGQDGEDMQAFMNSLYPGYFQTMGIKILDGRDFDRRDIREDSKVAIINQSFARHFFGDKSAIGRRLGRGTGPETKFDTEIIGVVSDSFYEGPREGVHRQVFVPKWGNGGASVYARVAMNPSSAYAAVRSQVKKLDAALPVYDLKTLATQLDQTLLSERLIAMLSAGFGLLATLLASIGLYGVMAFTVARRTKEMGVRMALGAARSHVVWLVMKEVLLLLAIGLAIGIPTAISLGKYVSSQLYGIDAADPWIAAGAVVVLTLVSATAGMIPARRASRIDPILALRYE